MDLFQQLQLIKRDVDERIVYDNSGTVMQLPDDTWVTKGSHGRGDCTVFAATYCKEAELAGLKCYKHIYKLDTGVWHETCIVEDKFILDVRHKEPIRVEDA